MLTVYSIQGSPGASTTAMHLAARWASTGREVLLIEADPDGGSLSHNFGIQFTPGSASFVASGLPALSNHLIDHCQDVLFENLHVMPAPSSPTGARGIFQALADFADELRTISANEMAVIVDGGRLTTKTATSKLTSRAAAVAVVCRHNSQLSNLEDLRGVLAADPNGDGPQGCAVAVGRSPMDAEEWHDNFGLTFCGSIELVTDMASDLSAYLTRSKRKSKKWRASLEQVGEKLYAYAQPPVPDSSGPSRPAEQTSPTGAQRPEDADQAASAAMAPAAETSVGPDPAGYGQAPPMATAPGAEYAQVPPSRPDEAQTPGYGQSHFLPPTPQAQPDYSQSDYQPPPHEQSPPEAHQQPQYQPPPHEQSPPEAHQQPQYQPPPHEQSPPEAHQQPQYQPPPHEQSPPEAHQQPQYQPPPHEQSPPEAHQQPQYQPPPHEQSPPEAHQQPQYQPPPHEQSPPEAHQQPQYQQPPHEQSPPEAHQQPQYQPPPHEQSPPEAHQQPQYQPPPHEQSPPEAHQQPQYQPPPHEQSPPEGYQPQYQQPQYQQPAHEQSPPGGYQQPQYQPPAHEQSPPGAYQQPYEQPQYQQPAHEQSPPGGYQPAYEQPQYQQPPHGQSPPGGYQQPGPSAFGDPPLLGERPGSGVPLLGAEPPRRPYISPTGSFRDWAVKLHDLDSRDATAHRRGV